MPDSQGMGGATTPGGVSVGRMQSNNGVLMINKGIAKARSQMTGLSRSSSLMPWGCQGSFPRVFGKSHFDIEWNNVYEISKCKHGELLRSRKSDSAQDDQIAVPLRNKKPSAEVLHPANERQIQLQRVLFVRVVALSLHRIRFTGDGGNHAGGPNDHSHQWFCVSPTKMFPFSSNDSAHGPSKRAPC